MKRLAVMAVLAASAPSGASTWTGRRAAPGAVDDAVLAERHARAFVRAHLRELAPGTAIDDFELAANVVDCSGAICKRTVSFQQTWRGMRVRDGQLSVVIARDAIFFAQSRAVPFIEIALGPEIAHVHAPRVDTARGVAAPRADDVTREIITLASEGQLRVHVAEHRVRGTWDEWVSVDGTVLDRVNRMRDATSTLVYDVPDRRPSMRRSVPARDADVIVDGAATTTGIDGMFSWNGSSATVVPGLVGPRVRVMNAAGALASANLTANDGQPTTWSLASDELGDAQLSAFVHVTIAKERARELLPGLAWIDQSLLVTVNEPGGGCNASSTGDDLHFFAGSAACENTARLVDVVYHELGHSLHFQGLIPAAGNYNLALSEGLADYFAASITGDSAIGRGFKFDDTPVRELDPVGFEKVAPDDLVPSQHQSGLIIGGALWDLRRMLIDRHGAVEGAARADRVFVGVLQRAPNIANSYMAALVGDDDNGDLADGTPNQCEIDVAFATHGLAPEGTPIRRFGPMRVDGASVELPVQAGTLACEPAIERAELIIDNAATPMSVMADAVRGTLPGSGVLRFSIEIIYADGSRRHFPENPADPLYTAHVGDTETIWCERFDTDPQWTVSLAGSPSPWEWGTPRGAAGDPSDAFTGQSVLGTQLTGDGRYASVAETSIRTPAIDASMYREVHLQFRRWLTVEDATYDQATVDVNGAMVWSNASAPDGFLSHWDREWRFVDHDVTGAATEPIVVTWKLVTDASRALGGWNIDDVCLVGIGKIARCGDSVVDDDEDCDGSNDCTSECTLEDVGCCSSSVAPHGSALIALGVLAMLRRRRR